jgi:acetate CoA/acetoacetate CoA-transferase alpha subunit
MAKIINAAQAAELIPDGARIMVGGFLGCGSPHKILEALAKSGKGNFTIICNDAAMPGGPLGEEYYAVAKLVHNRQVKKLIATHIGLNPEAGQQMNAGEMDVTLIPQGSFAEMIRAGGAGLGGVITPTGIGTIVEDAGHVHGKITIDGREYLIEKPLRADVALISGHVTDKAGNVWYKGTARNFNPAMATAADLVIAETDKLVEPGEIEPENIVTPGVYVD